MRVFRTRFTIPAASNTAITVAHSLGVSPVGAKLIAWGGGTAAGTGLNTGNIRLSWGVTDFTRSFYYAREIADARTSVEYASCASLSDTSGVVREIDESTDNVLGRLVYTSANHQQIVFTPAVQFAVAMEVELTLYASMNYYVDAFTSPASSADITRTGIPFRPHVGELVLAVGTMGAITGLAAFRAGFSYGVFDGTNQWNSFAFHQENPTDYTFDSFRSDVCGAYDLTLAGAYSDEIRFSAFTADGGTFSRPLGTTARPMCVVWMGGCGAKVGTIAARTAGAGDGTIDVPTPGFDAALLEFACNPPATATETATAESYEQIFGSALSTTSGQSATSWTFEPNAEPLNGVPPNVVDILTHYSENFVLRRWNRTAADTIAATPLMEIALQSMTGGSPHGGEKAVLVQTEEDVATLIGYLALGNPVGVGMEFPLPRRFSSIIDAAELFLRPFITLPLPARLARAGNAYGSPTGRSIGSPVSIPVTDNRRFLRVLDRTGAQGGAGGGGSSPGSGSPGGWPDRRRRFIAIADLVIRQGG